MSETAHGASEERRLGFRSIAGRLMAWVLGTCGLIYIGTLLYSGALSREMMVRSAEKEALNAAGAAIGRIGETLGSVEESARLAAALMERIDLSGTEVERVLESLVAGNPKIYGSAAAFAPRGFDDATERYAPYRYRKGETIAGADLATDAYRYWEREWFTAVERSGSARWSEPYFDEGGGEVWMVTYSVPFFHAGGERRLRGVVTADLALDWLNDQTGSIRVGRTGHVIVMSREGLLLAHPGARDSGLGAPVIGGAGPEVREIVERLLRGEAGFQPVYAPYLDKMARVAYAPVGSAGWSVAIVYPEDELMEEVNRILRRQVALLLGGLAALVIVVVVLSSRLTRPLRDLAGGAARIATGDLDLDLPPVRTRDELGALTGAFHRMRDSLKQYIRDLRETTAAKQKLESELEIARKIQMAMLPKGDIGEIPEGGYELSARLAPARAVGGDLYSHFLPDGRLVFVVGDVMGKGVPAALLMARVMTLLGTIAQRETDLQAAMKTLNRSLCADNDTVMFVTLFCGVLDLATGDLTFSSGGHEPPLAVPAGGGPARKIEVEGGPALGIFEEADYPVNRMRMDPGAVIVLYTDGVTEAMNDKEDFFSAERLLDLLSTAPPASTAETCDAVMESVRAFAAGAEQSDDITVMAVKYAPPAARERRD